MNRDGNGYEEWDGGLIENINIYLYLLLYGDGK
jgi:hypothetical protein